jgi:hypothetical protein
VLGSGRGRPHLRPLPAGARSRRLASKGSGSGEPSSVSIADSDPFGFSISTALGLGYSVYVNGFSWGGPGPGSLRPGGGGGGAPKKTPCQQAKYAKAVAFISANKAAAAKVASAIGTTPANILGHAGLESSWGSHPNATQGGNFFNLTVNVSSSGQLAPGSFNTGVTGFHQGGGGRYFAEYGGTDLEASGMAMASSYVGRALHGTPDAASYSASLPAKFDPGNAQYPSILQGAIGTAAKLLPCAP